MKKVALSLMALALVASLAFAEDSTAGTDIPAPLTAKITANGWGQVGVDLDTKSYGFKNGAEAKLFLKILDGTSTKGSEAYTGFIEVKELRVRYDDTALSSTGVALVATVGDITAKLILGDLYIKLYTNTDPSLKYSVDGDQDNGGASIVADDAFYTYTGLYGGTKFGTVSTEWSVGDLLETSAFAGTGFEVGYTIPKVASITGTIASRSAWSSTDTDGQDFEGSVALGLLAVDKLTLNVKGYIGAINAKNKQAAGAEFAYDLGVAVPFVHLNAAADIDSDGSGYYDADFGAKLPIVDGLKAVAVAKYDSASKVDFTLTADLAKAKLAGPLGALFGVQLKNLTSSVSQDLTKTTAVFAKVEADVADGFNVWGKTSWDSTAADKTDSLFLKAGVTASKLLPLTEFSVTWNSNDFGGSKEQGDNKLGELYLQAKVSY